MAMEAKHELWERGGVEPRCRKDIADTVCSYQRVGVIIQCSFVGAKF
jgi:hypothetical protein